MADERAFFVRPIDAVHFGPPTTSRAGDSHGGRSDFPPSPWAFQGIVRTRLLMAADPPLDLNDWSSGAVAERERLIGTPDRLPEGWRMTGPFPACFDGESLEPWLPCPRYLFTSGAPRGAKGAARSSRSAAYAEIVEPPPLVAGDDVPYGDVRTDVDPEAGRNRLAGLPRERRLAPATGWLPASSLYDVLAGLAHSTEPVAPVPPFVEARLKTGLALERDSKTAVGSMLYNRGYLRFRDGSGLLGMLSGEIPARIRHDALESGLGQAGRGSRPVAFEAVPALHPAFDALRRGRHVPTECARDPYGFWLVLATPARVETASPDAVDPLGIAAKAAVPAGVRLRVLAGVVGPPVTLGGFRMAAGDTRLAHAYVPAGSAWWCEVSGGDAAARAQALRGLHYRAWIGPREETPFGFGLTFVGLPPSARERS